MTFTPLLRAVVGRASGTAIAIAGASAIVGASIGVGCSGGADPAPIATLTPTERGAVYVTRRGCANCHQPSEPGAATLSGNETALLGRVHAPNLTPDRRTGLGAWSDDQIARAIRDGFALGGAPLCLQMPRFSRMSDHEVVAIIAYLRSLPPVTHDVEQSVCPPIRPEPADAGPDATDAGPDATETD